MSRSAHSRRLGQAIADTGSLWWHAGSAWMIGVTSLASGARGSHQRRAGVWGPMPQGARAFRWTRAHSCARPRPTSLSDGRRARDQLAGPGEGWALFRSKPKLWLMDLSATGWSRNHRSGPPPGSTADHLSVGWRFRATQRACPKRCPGTGPRRRPRPTPCAARSTWVRRGTATGSPPDRGLVGPGGFRGSLRQGSVLDTVVFVEPSLRVRTIARRPSPS
jgi:hypothetical protein